MSTLNDSKGWKLHRKRSRLKEYRSGTFDKYVAYGQRQRKLELVSRGIIEGFKVRCKSSKDAMNLARALRLRFPKIERGERARYSLRVKTDEETIYVTRKGPLRR